MKMNAVTVKIGSPRGFRYILAWGLVVLWMLPQSLEACVGCRQQTEETSAKTLLAGAAFSWSVLFMLAFVFTLLAGMMWLFVATCRRIEAERQSGS